MFNGKSVKIHKNQTFLIMKFQHLFINTFAISFSIKIKFQMEAKLNENDTCHDDEH